MRPARSRAIACACSVRGAPRAAGRRGLRRRGAPLAPRRRRRGAASGAPAIRRRQQRAARARAPRASHHAVPRRSRSRRPSWLRRRCTWRAEPRGPEQLARHPRRDRRRTLRTARAGTGARRRRRRRAKLLAGCTSTSIRRAPARPLTPAVGLAGVRLLATAPSRRVTSGSGTSRTAGARARVGRARRDVQVARQAEHQRVRRQQLAARGGCPASRARPGAPAPRG